MRKFAGIVAAFLLWCGTAGAAQLDLKECLERAAAANRGLKAAGYDITIAQDQITVTRSEALPRVDLQAGYVAQQAPQAVAFGPTSFATQQPDFAFLNFSIYQTLYDFGRTRARVESAKLLRDASRENFSATQQDIFLDVVRAYYGILEAEKLVQVAADEVAQMESHRRTAQALFDEGVVTRNDLLQAEVRVASSNQKLLAAKNNMVNGWLQLNYLMGAPPDFRASLTEGAEVIQLPTSQGRPDLSKRGEVAALRKAVSAGELSITEAKTAYYPEFFTKLALDYTQNDKVTEQYIMSATVGFKVNLFDGLATTSRVRQAVKARARDEERLRDLEARITLELSTAQNDLNVAAARIKVAQKAIEQGVENLRITRDRYQEKVGTATDVIDAQTLLTQIRTDYYQSVFDLQVSAARVKRATGEL